ncbi:MAG TPA: S8 family peptidase, partial [Actinopolymorphaceae bacterium]
TRKAPALRAEGVTTKRRVPSIAGASVRVAKDHAAEAWPRLRRAEGVERYWLNGKRRVLLSESVPQIGAPKAWDAGFDGEGVTVAVIDTGVDADHPDLADKVTASKDFTGEGPEDGFGHGTHVASIVAGTGAASDGKYTGVAPKAEVVSAKVCDSGGWCTDEAILGGMEWAAATQEAQIANLSLGGTDTPEIDPLEEAVDRLTEQTGTLFVIAAGNEGAGVGTIGSPGSAEAALTVGAVDKKDAMADFSSRGPTVGDAAIKPDVTAPGVDIAAGRARDTEMGPPVEDFPDSYVVASGTSMATPHVVGAAAILAQRHPDWKAADIKAALMASAAPQGKASVFDQGAGRIDVAAALGQTVVADPGSISFGRQLWPHDDDEPVTKQLTYRNLGSEDVELELSATMTGPDGESAPDGTVRLGATTVTVPEGGSATVDVTVATNHGGADGVYSGRVVASTGDLTVTTPIAVEKEVESYDVTIEHVDADGKPTNEYGGFLFALNEPFDTDVFSDEPTVKVRLPKGDYLYVDDIVQMTGEIATISRTVWPNLTVEEDQTLKVDARRTRPFEVTVPEKTARTALVDIGLERVAHHADGDVTVDLAILSGTLEGVSTTSVGKAAPKADLVSRVNTQWGKPGEAGDFFDSPYVYFLTWFERGRVPSGFTKDVRKKELAKVVSEHGIQVTKRQGSSVVFGAELEGSSGWTAYWNHDLPTTFTQYHTTKDVLWSKEVGEYEVDEEGWPVDQLLLSGADRRYRPGKSYQERWNVGVFGPAFPTSPWPWVGRAGDALSVGVPLWSDGAGHAGLSLVDEARTRLYRGKEKIAESEYDGYLEELVEVPAGPATYRLETSATRSSVADYSTRLDARWTFRSAHAGSEEKPAALPLWAARFRPRVDE